MEMHNCSLGGWYNASCIRLIACSEIILLLPMSHPYLTNRNVVQHNSSHDDVIKWKHFPRYWPYVRGIHWPRWIPHTKAGDAELWCIYDAGLWCLYTLICARINGWVNNREAGDLRRYRPHYDVVVMSEDEDTQTALWGWTSILQSWLYCYFLLMKYHCKPDDYYLWSL